MEQRLRYPIGQQDFKILREDDSVYIDKTRFIEKIILRNSRYYFLARPRRFGKSLFLSTLQYFFEGKRELFKGLHIDSIDWNWEPYPVLRLDLNPERYAGQGLLDDVLDNKFREWEKQYGVNVEDSEPSLRFKTIIRSIHETTGKRVVILVDEYDKPLVGNLNIEENFEHYRTKLAALYSNFKSSAEHIRLVFLTGVSRFSKLSVFSDLNNLKDITFDDEFADICGITEEELFSNLKPGIDELAKKLNITSGAAFALLKDNYDGYRFSESGSDIYNPWSLLNCLDSGKVLNYWSMTGGSTVIAESLYNVDADLADVLNTQCDMQSLAGLDLQNADPVALLYQTGYLTIKNYDRETDIFTLGIPNKEVRHDLFKVLLPYYTSIKAGTADGKIRDLITSIRLGKPEKLMKTLEAFFAGLPYDIKLDNENNFQNSIYILLSLIGTNAKVEEHMSNGRIDLLIETPKFVYIIELKFDGSLKQALRQIIEKDYARKYRDGSRKIFLIGANFSTKTRNIEHTVIEEES